MLDSLSFKSIIKKKKKKKETKTQKYNLNSNKTKRGKNDGMVLWNRQESKNHLIVSKYNMECFLFVTVVLL